MEIATVLRKNTTNALYLGLFSSAKCNRSLTTPASSKKPKLAPRLAVFEGKGHVFLPHWCRALCFLTQVPAGGPGTVIHHHSSAGRLQELKSTRLCSRKERKDTCYLKGDKHKGGNAWHHYSSIFWQLWCDIQQIVKSCLALFCTLAHRHFYGQCYSVQQMWFHLLYHVLVHFNCLEKSSYPEMSASHYCESVMSLEVNCFIRYIWKHSALLGTQSRHLGLA